MKKNIIKMIYIIISIVVLTMIVFIANGCTYNETTINNYYNIPSEKFDLNTNENRLVNLINQRRLSKGLSPLKVDNLASYVCEQAVDDAIENGFKGHDGYQERYEACAAITVGEICIKNNYMADTAFNGYIGSEEHREDIDSNLYNWIGISYKNGINYCLFLKY